MDSQAFNSPMKLKDQSILKVSQLFPCLIFLSILIMKTSRILKQPGI